MTKFSGLDNLADRVATAAHELGYIRVGGRVSEVAPDAFRLRGLSRHVRLGDRVEIAAADGARLAEVLRIDGDGVTVKPFAPRLDVGLGAAAWHAGPVVLAPHPSWKGRVIDAMAAPVDGLGPLTPGIAAPKSQPPLPRCSL